MTRRCTFLLLAVALSGPAGAARSSQATTAPAQTPTTTVATMPATRPATTQDKPGFRYGLFDQNGSHRGYPDTRRLFWQMLAYVLVILVLGGVGVFVVRKILPKLRTATGKRVRLLETVYLGPRQTVHLLQVGTQKFLVAGTRERVSMLAEVTQALGEEGTEAETPE